MANFTITISNTIDLNALALSKWGQAIWGVDRWGDSSYDLQTDVEKFLEDSVTLDSAIINSQNKNLSNEVLLSSDVTSLILNGGWDYVFGGTNDGENEINTNWSESSQDSVWVSGIAQTTTWS